MVSIYKRELILASKCVQGIQTKNVLEVVHVLWNHNELMQKLTRRLLKLNPINTEWKPGLAINSMR